MKLSLLLKHWKKKAVQLFKFQFWLKVGVYKAKNVKDQLSTKSISRQHCLLSGKKRYKRQFMSGHFGCLQTYNIVDNWQKTLVFIQ